MNYSKLTTAINTNIEYQNGLRYTESRSNRYASSLKTELQVKQMCNKIVKHISTLNIVDTQIIEDKIVLFYSTGYSTGSVNLGMEYYDLIFPTKESTLINDAEYDLIKNLGKNAKVSFFKYNGGLYIKVENKKMYIYSLNEGHVLQTAVIDTNIDNLEYYVADIKNFSRNLDNSEVVPNWTKEIKNVFNKDYQYITFDTKELTKAINFVKNATYQNKITYKESELTSENVDTLAVAKTKIIGKSNEYIQFSANYKFILSCIDKKQPITKIGVSGSQMIINDNHVVMQMRNN